MTGWIARGLADCLRGVMVALRRRPMVFVAAGLGMAAASILLPPLVLSVARKPVDYFTFNPWLTRLPEYLAAPGPLGPRLARLPDLALFWFSADSPYGGTEWGFAVDVRDLARIAATSALVGAYVALWRERRALGHASAWAARGSGLGAVGAMLGLSTGPCSVMGCGAPVLPVVALAVGGLSSGTLAVLSGLSTVVGRVVLVVLVLAVGCLGWLVGVADREVRRSSAGRRRV
jgi:hypothetical protein